MARKVYGFGFGDIGRRWPACGWCSVRLSCPRRACGSKCWRIRRWGT